PDRAVAGVEAERDQRETDAARERECEQAIQDLYVDLAHGDDEGTIVGARQAAHHRDRERVEKPGCQTGGQRRQRQETATHSEHVSHASSLAALDRKRPWLSHSPAFVIVCGRFTGSTSVASQVATFMVEAVHRAFTRAGEVGYLPLLTCLVAGHASALPGG